MESKFINNEPNYDNIMLLAKEIVRDSKIKSKDLVVEMLELGRRSYLELQRINNKEGVFELDVRKILDKDGE